MSEHAATYSQIIDPELYNELMTDYHRYIAAADTLVNRRIQRQVLEKGAKELVELGCGPARVTEQHAVNGIERVTAYDHDKKFLEYAREVIENTRVRIVDGDILTFDHGRPIDIATSMGTHHHLEKGAATEQYLRNIERQLSPDGIYIVGDEFLPEYADEEDRHLKATIWYSHIIGSAIRDSRLERDTIRMGKYLTLAVEEAKTFIDDLNESGDHEAVKTPEQIQLVLDFVSRINDVAVAGNMVHAEILANMLLLKLGCMRSTTRQEDPTIGLSRGDSKISLPVFEREVTPAGFEIDEVQGIGPIEKIGGLVVVTLKKRKILG